MQLNNHRWWSCLISSILLKLGYSAFQCHFFPFNGEYEVEISSLAVKCWYCNLFFYKFYIMMQIIYHFHLFFSIAYRMVISLHLICLHSIISCMCQLGHGFGIVCIYSLYKFPLNAVMHTICFQVIMLLIRWKVFSCVMFTRAAPGNPGGKLIKTTNKLSVSNRK